MFKNIEVIVDKLFCKFVKVNSLLNNKSVMHRALVRNVGGEERLQICFKFPPSMDGTAKQRIYNFNRSKSEELQITLSRISASVSKMANKRANKKIKSSVSGNEEISVSLFQHDDPVDGMMLNEEAWKEGLSLVVGDLRYNIQLNVPTIKTLSLPKIVMSGFFIYPEIEVEFADESNCKLIWYRERKKENKSNKKNFDAAIVECMDECNSEKLTVETKVASAIRKRNVETLSWDLVSTARSYIPSEDDVGCFIKVDCLPNNSETEGEIFSSITKSEVVSGPGICPFERRHGHTKRPSEKGCFRIISYNILADLYADSDFSRDVLFPYCPPKFLDVEYRKHLIIKELLGYNADIICLQEVDRKLFNHDLKPILKEFGLDGFQKLKKGEVAEGCATFYRQSKFRFVEQQDIVLSESLQDDISFQNIFEKISKSESLKRKVMDRSSVLQVTLLQSLDDRSKYILACTVHLYFHPRAAHVRLIQTAICIHHIENILEKFQSQGIRASVIFCGDLNSYPEGGVHEYLNNKCIMGSHADWYSAGKEDFVEEMNFEHKLNLSSACGYPRYTNYVPGFSAALDYIYIDKNNLKPLDIIPMPTHEEVIRFTALPNKIFPSDHIAIGCDITWTP